MHVRTYPSAVFPVERIRTVRQSSERGHSAQTPNQISARALTANDIAPTSADRTGNRSQKPNNCERACDTIITSSTPHLHSLPSPSPRGLQLHPIARDLQSQYPGVGGAARCHNTRPSPTNPPALSPSMMRVLTRAVVQAVEQDVGRVFRAESRARRHGASAAGRQHTYTYTHLHLYTHTPIHTHSYPPPCIHGGGAAVEPTVPRVQSRLPVEVRPIRTQIVETSAEADMSGSGMRREAQRERRCKCVSTVGPPCRPGRDSGIFCIRSPDRAPPPDTHRAHSLTHPPTHTHTPTHPRPHLASVFGAGPERGALGIVPQVVVRPFGGARGGYLEGLAVALVVLCASVRAL